MKNYIIGNWKMNHSIKDIQAFFEFLIPACDQISFDKNEVWIAPQFIHIPNLINLAKNTLIKIGAQDIGPEVMGAYTGQVSANALSDINCAFTLIGHSERRLYQMESEELLLQKLNSGINSNLKVVYCIGETLEEKEMGRTTSVLTKQLENVLTLDNLSLINLIIAYEPIWAIGTGKTASNSEVDKIHEFIRKTLQDQFKTTANDIPIIYGGSVKPVNSRELLSMPQINGLLIGGASLNAESFVKIATDN